MRPTKLTMSAFGPYAGVTEIAFDALGASGVYLVCGDTGSGKTMIFDAICFALFGEASGDAKGGARSTVSMRSDYASAASKTFVELTFEYRGDSYRIKRNPEYERAKDRGEGTTKQKADAEIELPDGRVVSGVRKVNAEVEALLGIDSEQFKQIVMLAQGEFRKLLTADTETRQVIFRKLFGTERYELVQERLAEESRKLERDNARVKAQIATLAQQARFPEDGPLAEQAAAAGASESRLGDWLHGALEELLAQDGPAYAELDGQVEALRVKWSEANALLKQVEGRPALEVEREHLAADVAALKASAPELAAAFDLQKGFDAERVAASERAAVVEGTFAKYEELQRAQAARDEAQRSRDQAARAFDEAVQEDGAAGALLSTLAAEKAVLQGADVRLVQAQSRFEGVSAEAEAARKALSDAEELEARAAAATRAGEALEAARVAKERAGLVEARDREALDAAQARCDALSDATSQLAEARAAREAAEREASEARDLAQRRQRLAAGVDEAAKPHADALERLSKAEEAHASDLFAAQELQRRQRAGRAGLLAAELVEGAPCPVCGSRSHPAPATPEASVPTDDEIDVAVAREAASAKAATDLSLEAEGLKATVDERRAQLASFDEEHGGADGLASAAAAAAAKVASTRELEQAAEARKRDADAASGELASARVAHAASAAAFAEAEAAFARAREQSILAENTAATLRATLGALDATAAREACAAADARLAAARDALDAARKDDEAFKAKCEEVARAEERATKATQALAQAKDAGQRASAALAQAAERVAHFTADLEFASLALAQEEALRLRRRAKELGESRDAAERAVSENAAQLATKEALLVAKVKQLSDIPEVDVEATRLSMAGFQRDAERLKNEASQVKSRIDANQSCLDALDRALEKAGGIEERYGRVKLLADVATGNLVGQAKVRFEAYVQAIYFDKVIAAANERLKVLTSGQFELVRYSEGTGNAKAGLGLYVIDSYTGRARDASSLSGGESFQASLCLALGLSDIVQAHAGGVEFDTMFVDEGFGSLDQGALGNAISLLSDLSGSTKLVGIISHVEDLKANIPKKLVVTKSRAGSSVALEL